MPQILPDNGILHGFSYMLPTLPSRNLRHPPLRPLGPSWGEAGVFVHLAFAYMGGVMHEGVSVRDVDTVQPNFDKREGYITRVKFPNTG
jgi:hypothetical protein